MDTPSLLYLAFLTLQLYALFIHFYHPASGSSDLGRQRLLILLSIACGAVTFLSILPLSNIPTPDGWRYYYATAAGLILLLSAVLFIWVAITTRPRRLAIIYGKVTPKYVIRSGPFAYSRHPTYLSYALGWIGSIALMIAKGRADAAIVLVAFASLAALLRLYQDAADLEEKQFGQQEVAKETRREYEMYRKVTPQWLPGVG